MLKYPVQFFERDRLSRVQAVSLVLLLALTIAIILCVTLVPVVIDQMLQLFNQIPGWLESIQANLQRFDTWARQHHLPLNLSGFSNQINTHFDNQLPALAKPALGFALGTLTGLLDVVLVVVLAFYMLLYGEPLWKALVNLLPPHIGSPLSASLQLNFHNFFISQLLLVIAAVIVQQIKDNVVAPRLMSDFISLNPILIFIVSLIGAETVGLLGAVVAVPIAGTIKGTIVCECLADLMDAQ